MKRVTADFGLDAGVIGAAADCARHDRPVHRAVGEDAGLAFGGGIASLSGRPLFLPLQCISPEMFRVYDGRAVRDDCRLFHAGAPKSDGTGYTRSQHANGCQKAFKAWYRSCCFE